MAERDAAATLWLPYAQMKTAPAPLAVVGAAGARLALQDGRELIDGISSWWPACHGYNHPHIRARVAAQLEALPHVMLGGLVGAPTVELAKRLAAVLPGDLQHVFFSESGSVSVEIALKIAIQFWIHHGEPERSRFVSFRYGYHGDTFAAMSVCDPEEGMHGLFKNVLAAQILTDLPRSEAALEGFDALLEKRRAEVAAVVLEPLAQCAGGMKFHEPDILRGIADACRRRGVLLILDEIATGFGRTGTLFACEQAEVVPDILTLSKALTGGTLPLAATIATDRVYDAFWSDDPEHALMHGPTFSGNPLACAAACASLDLFEREPRLEQVHAIERQLVRELAACASLPGVRDVRVLGALGAVQLAGPFDGIALREQFIARGVWIRPFADVVYLAPPFVIEANELSQLTGAIFEVLSKRAEAMR